MNNKKWTEEEVKFLKENFLNMTKQQLAEKLNRTPQAVQLKANKIGLKRPEKYTYDKQFFKYINTEEKAYWLGFFFSDGYVQKTCTSAEAAIMLGVKDIEHLKKFNKSIKGNVQVTTMVRGSGFSKDKKYEMAVIRLYSSELVNDLISLGCVPNKSKLINFPAIDKNFVWSFIRGFFDGDGSITLDKKRNVPSCNFTSASLEFLVFLRNFFYQEKINSYYTQEKSGCYRLWIRGMENVTLFLDNLYENSSIYLDRKYERYIQYMEECNIRERIKNNTGHHRKIQ